MEQQCLLAWPLCWPLFMAVLWLLTGFSLKRLPASLLCALVALPNVVLAIVTLTALAGQITLSPLQITWFSTGAITVELALLAGKPALMLLATVFTVSSAVQVFSISYLTNKDNFGRYFAGVNFFTASMAGLVLSDNLLVSFCCWELMGFCSWALISYYSTATAAAPAALKAFLINRTADAGFLLALMVCAAHFHTFSITEIEAATKVNGHGFLITLAGFGLLWAALGKSAQFPFQVWLPDAMAGPTPVSALIHAATMVAAGIFLLFRMHFMLAPVVMQAALWLGVGTALFAALSALVQTDLKRILAYSTISQLGIMLAAIGLNAPDAAFFHLLTHALFKAGLFLGAASVIKAIHSALPEANAQDIRLMGGLGQKMPITATAFTVCGAALSGLPFSSGFLSKEGIASAAWFLGAKSGTWLPFAMLICISGLTAAYTLRLVKLVFLGAFRGQALAGAVWPKEPTLLVFPLAVLALGALFPAFSTSPFHTAFWLPADLKINSGNNAVLWFTLSAICIGSVFAMRKTETLIAANQGYLGRIALAHFGFNRIYSSVISPVFRSIATQVAKLDAEVLDTGINQLAKGSVVAGHFAGATDKYLIDAIVKNAGFLVRKSGYLARSIQGTNAQQFITLAVAGFLLLLWFIL